MNNIFCRFPGPGLKRVHPHGSESRQKSPEPVISQIIDKLKHINQVSCCLSENMNFFFYMWTLQCTSVNNHTLPCHQSSERYTAVRKLITSVLTPSQQSACHHTNRCTCLHAVLWSAVLQIIRLCDRGSRYLYGNADKAEAFIHFLSSCLPLKNNSCVSYHLDCVCV